MQVTSTADTVTCRALFLEFLKHLILSQREINSEDLRQHFAEFGNIEDAVIVADQNGVSRGFGFVTFDNVISIEKALIVKHTFGDRVVDCKRAVPKDEINRQQVRFVSWHTIGNIYIVPSEVRCSVVLACLLWPRQDTDSVTVCNVKTYTSWYTLLPFLSTQATSVSSHSDLFAGFWRRWRLRWRRLRRTWRRWRRLCRRRWLWRRRQWRLWWRLRQR